MNFVRWHLVAGKENGFAVYRALCDPDAESKPPNTGGETPALACREM
jgi:hypothetical protein